MNKKIIQKGLFGLAFLAFGLMLSHSAFAAKTLMLIEHGYGTAIDNTKMNWRYNLYTNGGEVPGGGTPVKWGHSEWYFSWPDVVDEESGYPVKVPATIKIYRHIWNGTPQLAMTIQASGYYAVREDGSSAAPHASDITDVCWCRIDGAPVAGALMPSVTVPMPLGQTKTYPAMDFSTTYYRAYYRGPTESKGAPLADVTFVNNSLWIFSDVPL